MTILADTNIWCDHFQRTDATLSKLIEYDFLLIHEVVVGELSVGSFRNREQTLQDLQILPKIRQVSFEETLHFIQERRLWGRGLQWNDFLLLASVIVAADCLLFTRDKRLRIIARELGVSYEPI